MKMYRYRWSRGAWIKIYTFFRTRYDDDNINTYYGSKNLFSIIAYKLVYNSLGRVPRDNILLWLYIYIRVSSSQPHRKYVSPPLSLYYYYYNYTKTRYNVLFGGGQHNNVIVLGRRRSPYNNSLGTTYTTTYYTNVGYNYVIYYTTFD